MCQISVLIPTYNSIEWLEAALQSVLLQGIEYLECVVVDDCSTDGTWEFVEDFAKSNSWLRGIRLEQNIGVSCVRNRLLAEARGQWIIFLDSDDIFVEGAFAKFFKILGKTAEIDIYVTDFYVLKKSGRRLVYRQLQYTVDNPIESADLFRMYPMSTVRFYRWGFLVKYGIDFADFRNFEDVVFWYKLIVHNPKVYYISEPLYVYRIRANSLSENRSIAKMQERMRALVYLLENILPIYFTSCPALMPNISQRVLKTLELSLRGQFSSLERRLLFTEVLSFMGYYFQEISKILQQNKPKISLNQHCRSLPFLPRQVYVLYTIAKRLAQGSAKIAYLFLQISGFCYRIFHSLITLVSNYKPLK